jgi:hypothetical protein
MLPGRISETKTRPFVVPPSQYLACNRRNLLSRQSIDGHFISHPAKKPNDCETILPLVSSIMVRFFLPIIWAGTSIERRGKGRACQKGHLPFILPPEYAPGGNAMPTGIIIDLI